MVEMYIGTAHRDLSAVSCIAATSLSPENFTGFVHQTLEASQALRYISAPWLL